VCKVLDTTSLVHFSTPINNPQLQEILKEDKK